MKVNQLRRAGLQILAATSLVALMAGCSISSGSSDNGGASGAATSPATAVTTTSATDTVAASGSTTNTSSVSAQGATTDTTNTNASGVSASGATTTTAAGAPEAAPAPLTTDFTAAVRAVTQKVRPAVVQITNQQVQFDQFTNQQFNVPAGVGSGVIYDSQGHILTNNHVVEGASQLLVSLPDGRSFPAKLVGADPQTDLAVVQITGTNLPVAQLGNSAALQVGDWVVAIGNALALPGGPTVTAGVVSALHRTVQEPGSQTGNGAQSAAGPFLFDVVQTDAAINPGNSGGPLINLAGQVIGINTLVAGQAEPGVAAQGIGFAISVNAAKPIADQLVASGKVQHVFLGIRYVALNPAIAQQLGTNAKNGIAVAQVVSGSPADQAGLKARDIITAVDGTQIVDESTLAQVLSTHKVGDKVSLSILRGNQQMTITVILGAQPSA